MSKKIIFIDMDNVVVDFPSAFPKIEKGVLEQYQGNEDEIPGIFSLMNPKLDAVRSVNFLALHFDVFFLSTAPWENPSAWSDKLLWIQKYFPEVGYKRLILSHNKHLNSGDYLIDDRLANGADKFKGEHIHFGQSKHENWIDVITYLCNKENIQDGFK
ncbi:5' nucleotidase, NT5C type [Tenacibaculum sp. A30]|uniref:5' nucleotidase, NT5C type n=1 Tax=Tenacibaculum sp. A30 TaxID=3442644 RepID=UPI003EC04A06